ncbi:TPA: hypothetical protein ACN36E_004524 [Vibrio parahaemolyticus]|uniref:hypothetical protein n=1 Tax=Vibrio parahaemolyticus TaxID=670 RepID=UPI001483671F|nr:hypothetical protein [Vibrio parahaemolyticus]EHP3974519.1 hypothetical protein [Vibrio parahaemolyticus]
MLPSILYKYRSFEKYTILGLINNSYWLPKPYNLNDPFDVQIKPIHQPISQTEFANELEAFLVAQRKINNVDFQYQNVGSLYENGEPSKILRENVKSFSRSVEQIANEIGGSHYLKLIRTLQCGRITVMNIVASVLDTEVVIYCHCLGHRVKLE